MFEIQQSDGTPVGTILSVGFSGGPDGKAFPFPIHVMPMSVPQIVTAAGAPAVVHSNDFSPVTASKPAAAGELLSVFASGVGEIRRGSGSRRIPCAVDGYQVNFECLRMQQKDLPRSSSTRPGL